MSRLGSAALAFVAVFGSLASARAQVGQPWLEDRAAEQGDGIRSGNLEWHPGVAGEVGYDSNFFQAPGPPGTPEIGTYRLRLTPSLSLQTLGGARVEGDAPNAEPPKARFRASAALGLDKLFATEDEYAELVSDSTYVNADLDAALNVAPERPWGADFTAGYTRIAQPYNAPGIFSYDRGVYRGGGDLRFRPWGGLLEWNLGYGGSLITYDQSDYELDHVSHAVRTHGTWRFFPRTGLLYQGEVGWVRRLYLGSRLRDANPVSTQLGLNGLIGARFGVLLMGGWKAIYFGADPAGNIEEFDGPIGRAELTWFISPVVRNEPTVGFSSLRLGYFRDAHPSELGNFYQIDKGFADLTAHFGQVFLLRASGGFAQVRHSIPRSESGAPLALPAPKEVRPDAQLYGEYRLSRSFALFANGGFSASPRNNEVSTGQGRSVSLRYTRHTVMLGARWFL